MKNWSPHTAKNKAFSGLAALLLYGTLLSLPLGCHRSPPIFTSGSIQLQNIPIRLENGEVVDFPTDFRGRWVLLGWIYTHCPDVCPLTASLFSQLRDSLVRAGYGAARVQLLLFSFDPERDNLLALAQYAQHFGADSMLHFARIEPEHLLALTQTLGFHYKKIYGSKQPRRAYRFAHEVKIYLIDPDGVVIGVHQGTMENPFPPSEVLKILRKKLRTMETDFATLSGHIETKANGRF